MIERHPIISRASWLQMRLHDITASDIGAICGEDPWRTPLAVWAEKTGRAPGKTETPIMKRGRWLEGAVFEALQELKPRWAFKRAKVYLRDPEHRIGATPDGFASDPEREGVGVIQAKVIAKAVFERDWSDGYAPMRYTLQTLTEAMLAAGLNQGPVWAGLAVLVVSEYAADIQYLPVERNEAVEARIYEHVARFWHLIDSGTQPPPHMQRDRATLDAMFPRDKGTEIDLSRDNEAADLIDGYLTITSTLRELENQREELATALKVKVGDAAVAICAEGRKVHWKVSIRKAHMVPEWRGRVLRVYGAKEKRQ